MSRACCRFSTARIGGRWEPRANRRMPRSHGHCCRSGLAPCFGSGSTAAGPSSSRPAPSRWSCPSARPTTSTRASSGRWGSIRPPTASSRPSPPAASGPPTSRPPARSSCSTRPAIPPAISRACPGRGSPGRSSRWTTRSRQGKGWAVRVFQAATAKPLVGAVRGSWVAVWRQGSDAGARRDRTTRGGSIICYVEGRTRYPPELRGAPPRFRHRPSSVLRGRAAPPVGTASPGGADHIRSSLRRRPGWTPHRAPSEPPSTGRIHGAHS